jgi:hypothetical protein
MDPYLEHPEYFHELHNRLIVYLQDALQPLLPEPFYARSSRRIWIEEDERHVEPDVDVLVHARRAPPAEPPGAAVATLAGTHPVLLTAPQLPDEEHYESYLEVYSGRSSEKRLITSVEILSLFNKRAGSQGRNMFLSKQREMRAASVNLVEIDLLRGGTHATTVPATLLRSRCSELDYHVCVHKADQPRDYFVYPFQLTDPLPRIAIPLSPGVEMPVIDLQAVFTCCYDAASYEREFDYARDEIVPPLAGEQIAWAKNLIAGRAQ